MSSNKNKSRCVFESPPMKENIKRAVRRLKIILGIVLLLPIALLLTLYLPFIQQKAKKQATIWLTQQTGKKIQIENLRLSFPLYIEAQEIHIGSTLSFKKIATSIRIFPLIHSTIKADFINTEGISYRLNTPVHSEQISLRAKLLNVDNIQYQWNEHKAHIGNIMLADGDATIHEFSPSSSKDTLTGIIPLELTISGIQLHRVNTTYKSQKVLLEAAGNITSHDITIDTTMQVSMGDIDLRNGLLTLKKSGMNPWELTNLTSRATSLRYYPKNISGELTLLTFNESHGIRLDEGAMAFVWKDGIVSLPYFKFRTEHSSINGHLRALDYHNSRTSIDGDVEIQLGHNDALLLANMTDNLPKELTRLYPTETLSASIAIDGPIDKLQISQCNISLPTAFDINLKGSMYAITDSRRREASCHLQAQTYNLDFLAKATESIGKERITIPHGITCVGNFHYAPDTIEANCSLTINQGTVSFGLGFRPSAKLYTLQAQIDSLNMRHILPERDFGHTNLQMHLTGNGLNYQSASTSIYGALKLHSLEWRESTFSNASAQISVRDNNLHAKASYSDSTMDWNLTTSIRRTQESVNLKLHAQVEDLNTAALKITDTDLHTAFQCYAVLDIDSTSAYTLRGSFNDIRLTTSSQAIQPKPLYLRAELTPKSMRLDIRSGDLTLNANTQNEGLAWQSPSLQSSGKEFMKHLSNLQATLSIGNDNPASDYLALKGITYNSLYAKIDRKEGGIAGRITIKDINVKEIKTDSVRFAVFYNDSTLHAKLSTEELTWHTPLMQLRGKVNCTLSLEKDFQPNMMTGMLQLSNVQYTLPTYSLWLHTIDTLSIPFARGEFHLSSLPLYTADKQPMLLNGKISVRENMPIANIRLSARNVSLLQKDITRETLLYGRAMISGDLTLTGPLNELSLKGNLRILPTSFIHYTYKNAILTANNQIDNVVTFVSLNDDTASQAYPKKKIRTNGFTMDLNIHIDPTALLEISFGMSKQNMGTIQGGGNLNLQYIPAAGLRLSGKYTIETGILNMNIPLLHVNRMNIHPGGTVIWSGNPRNPQLNISAEDHIRASITLEGGPQSVLFVAGVSLTDTMEKLGIRFTLEAPENASMQNTLAALAPEERSKLAVALLTTGLYLGEGGTGNLMNTALMGILQSQLDNLSRDIFRTVDVSVGIEPLPDGISGISTRTDYSFSVSKRFWNDRIRIIIGGSVTTSNERIEEDAVIDNISIEWRITPNGNQYLRFFYDKNFESILEGEIRETGIGYAYRRQLRKLHR